MLSSGLIVCFQSLLSNPCNNIFEDSTEHAVLMQEVLRCLHSHLGSRTTSQASTALDALLQLLDADATALLSYAAFLTGMLDYLQGYGHDQVQQVNQLCL